MGSSPIWIHTFLIVHSLHIVHSALPGGSINHVDPGMCEHVCVYDDKISNADCRQLNLERIPKATGKCARAWHVDFNYNMIQYVQFGDFSGYTSVEILLLGNNQIGMLQPNMWSNSSRLTQLHINNNRMTNITQRSFAKVASLTHLYLDYNRINNLHPDAFYGLTRLGKLFLLNNVIVTLPDDVFKHLKTLSTLNLSNNKLSEIKTKTFNGLKRLKHLDLSSNELSSIEAESFLDLHELIWVSLSDNNLLHFPISVLIGVPFQTVKLSQNNISSIDNLGMFLSQTDLKEFAISDNPLICDCAIEPLVQWYKRNDPGQNAICEYPIEFKGVQLIKYNESCSTTPAPQESFTLMARNSTGNGITPWIALYVIVFVLIITICVVVLFLAVRRSKNTPRYCSWNNNDVPSGTHGAHQYDEVGPDPPIRSTSRLNRNHRSNDTKWKESTYRPNISLSGVAQNQIRLEHESLSPESDEPMDIPKLEFD